MQLSPGERSFLAYFPSDRAAEAAAKELKRAGYDNVQVDRISKYGETHNAVMNNTPMGWANTVTGLTLYSAGTDNPVDNDKRVLLGADPSVSGYGNHNYGTAGGRSYLVTVVTNDDLAGQAEEIIKRNGGAI